MAYSGECVQPRVPKTPPNRAGVEPAHLRGGGGNMLLKPCIQVAAMLDSYINRNIVPGTTSNDVNARI